MGHVCRVLPFLINSFSHPLALHALTWPFHTLFLAPAKVYLWHHIVGIPPDTNNSNMEDYNTFLKACILKIRWFVALRLISYPFIIWASVASQIETDLHVEDFILWNMFWLKLFILKYHLSCFKELTFKVERW